MLLAIVKKILTIEEFDGSSDEGDKMGETLNRSGNLSDKI
jgi:hypothetical protein